MQAFGSQNRELPTTQRRATCSGHKTATMDPTTSPTRPRPFVEITSIPRLIHDHHPTKAMPISTNNLKRKLSSNPVTNENIHKGAAKGSLPPIEPLSVPALKKQRVEVVITSPRPSHVVVRAPVLPTGKPSVSESTRLPTRLLAQKIDPVGPSTSGALQPTTAQSLLAPVARPVTTIFHCPPWQAIPSSYTREYVENRVQVCSIHFGYQ